MARESWIGPIQIGRLLDACLDPEKVLVPPTVGSVYVITRHGWVSVPTAESEPLYVGGITGRSHRFRTRIGDTIIDAFGFGGHSSGGQSLHEWCLREGVNPSDLHIAWVEGHECHRCLEGRLYKAIGPKLNKMAPPRCTAHSETSR